MESRIIKFEYIQNPGSLYSIKRAVNLNTIILSLSQRIPIVSKSGTTLVMPYSLCIFGVNEEINMELCSGTEVIIISFDRLGVFYERKLYSFLHENKTEDDSMSSLAMTNMIKSYTCSMVDTYLSSLDDRVLVNLKFDELLYMIFKSDFLEKVAAKLKPVLQISDPGFRNCVLDHYAPKISVKNLADSCGYTIAHFEELFRKEFKMLPKEWLRNQMASQVKDKLLETDYSIQEISDILGMSSPQQMTRFCKKNFGMCPSKMRI